MSRTPVHAVGDGTSLADRKRDAGQRLMIGFEGHAVDDDLRELVREVQPGGFVLFQRNVAEPAQVLELCRELHSLVDAHRPPILAIDQEGGRVQRVRAPATVWPAARTVARADLTEAVSHALALELRAMGLDLNFAPVADVDSNPDNPVIGDRSFGSDPRAVAQHVAAFLRGHQAAGVGTCAKHLPGHGDTHLDAHLALPTVEVDLPELQHRELVPFRAAVAAGVDAVMTAHVLFPAYDEDLPATLSPHILPRLLRQDMGFDGVVFSDDLDMKAVADRWPMPFQAAAMTTATVDVLLCCRSPQRQWDAFHALVHLQESDASAERQSQTAARRVHRLREHLKLGKGPRPDLGMVGTRAHLDLAQTVLDRGA